MHLAGEAHDFGPSKRAAVYAFFTRTLGLEALPEDADSIATEPPEALEVWNAAHPLPPHAIRGSAAVAAALARLTGAKDGAGDGSGKGK